MPGTSAGTGQPLSFRCQRCRRQRLDPEAGRASRVRLTGNKKEVQINQWIRIGRRYGLVSREYRCLDCGWVGWSRHKDLERKERNS